VTCGGFAVDANNFRHDSGGAKSAGRAGQSGCTRPRSRTCCFSAEFRTSAQFFPSIAMPSITKPDQSCHGDIVLRMLCFSYCRRGIMVCVLMLAVCPGGRRKMSNFKGRVPAHKKTAAASGDASKVCSLASRHVVPHTSARARPRSRAIRKSPQLIQKDKMFHPSLLVIPGGGRESRVPQPRSFFFTMYFAIRRQRQALRSRSLYESGSTQSCPNSTNPVSLTSSANIPPQMSRRGNRAE